MMVKKVVHALEDVGSVGLYHRISKARQLQRLQTRAQLIKSPVDSHLRNTSCSISDGIVFIIAEKNRGKKKGEKDEMENNLIYT